MTIHLAIQNDEFSILLSDRRLSQLDGNGPAPVTDEYGKSGVVRCADGIFAYGFAGLATRGRFSMNTWLIDRLKDASKPACGHQELIQAFVKLLNATFPVIPEYQSLAPNTRRVTIVFVGYFFDTHDIYGRDVLVSNYEDFSPGITFGRQHSVGAFKEYVYTQDPTAPGDFFNVTAIGNWPAVKKAQVEEVNRLALELGDRNAVVAKALKILSQAAAKPAARNNIGRQIDEIFIPHDPKATPISRYHTATPTNRIWIPPFIDVSGRAVTVQPGFFIVGTPKDGSTRPWAVQTVPMNSPCPCKSGLGYRDCHGAANARTVVTLRAKDS